LERELEELGERCRVVAALGRGARNGLGIPVQRVLEEPSDVELVRGKALSGALGVRSRDARLAEVAREAPQLRRDLFGLTGERALAEERATRGDRLGRGLGRQIDRDVRRRGR
jgi:hypothetical protein